MLRAVLCLTALLAAMPAGATDPRGSVGVLDLAARLYAQGVAADDAVSVVTAVRMADGVTLRRATGWERTTAPAPGSGKMPRAATSALALILGEAAEAARLMAEDNDDLIEILDTAEAAGARGPVGSANAAEAVWVPGTADRWTLPLAGQERAEIGVFSDGAARFGWRITGPDGTEVCAATPSEEPLFCSFIPAENAFYTVALTGAGAEESRYLLITN